jgi:DNA-nicking Smr family endonuclease
MKPKKATFTQTPFENLKELMEGKQIKLCPDYSQNNPPVYDEKRPDPAMERKLFLEAMADVVPIKKKQYQHFHHPAADPPSPSFPAPESSLKELNNLIKFGEGFVIAQTAEYIEGAQAQAHPEITRLLHGGHFSIQGHIDLHGLNITDAKNCFDNFIRNALITYKKGLLIVHGRGLSSPVEPVLKNKVFQWLSSGHWRKWVVAFTSARACDGGAGATYVLLRNHPAKKYRDRKKS